MRQIIGAACGFWIALAGLGLGQTSTSGAAVVVELYTSQGCSACPPADDYLATLAANPQVIPLALHVDYWDYIGWKDRFASPRFTDRQKAYAHAVGSRTIYTPQMIVAGRERVEGHRPDELNRLIRAHLAAGQTVGLTLRREGGRLRIRAEANPPLTHPVRVQVVRYRPSETVDIKHGENAGRTITYRNIVTSWQIIGHWPGDAPLELEAAAEGPEPVVVILQKEGPAEILAAARLE
ncbi:MAG TPA: DUF1223 domain-containing protein [Paracoccaceae bacterium]